MAEEIVWPKGMNYLATDANGAQYFFPDMPKMSYTKWVGACGLPISNDNAFPDWKKSLIRRDPYAELRAAAKDPTKQIRCGDGLWRDAGYIWYFNSPIDMYEIRDKPAKKTAYRRLYAGAVKPKYAVALVSEDLKTESRGVSKWLGPIEEFTYEESTDQ